MSEAPFQLQPPARGQDLDELAVSWHQKHRLLLVGLGSALAVAFIAGTAWAGYRSLQLQVADHQVRITAAEKRIRRVDFNAYEACRATSSAACQPPVEE